MAVRADSSAGDRLTDKDCSWGDGFINHPAFIWETTARGETTGEEDKRPPEVSCAVAAQTGRRSLSTNWEPTKVPAIATSSSPHRKCSCSPCLVSVRSAPGSSSGFSMNSCTAVRRKSRKERHRTAVHSQQRRGGRQAQPKGRAPSLSALTNDSGIRDCGFPSAPAGPTAAMPSSV
jgi:hypothetical protein